MKPFNFIRFSITCTAVTLVTAGAVQANDWPSRPVRLIVGYPAGSSPDTVARVIQPALSQALGQPVVVENKQGAGGNIGVDMVVKSKDDHTFGITTNGPLTTAQQLYGNLPYSINNDVRPLSLAATSALVLVTSVNVPANSAKEFIAWSKAQPHEVSFGSIGSGSGSHLTMELFSSRAGLKMLHVPFHGFPMVTQSLIANDVQSAFMAPSGALAQAKAGKVKVLAISSSKRSTQLPDIPTIAESAGLPDFNAELWIAAFAPVTMSSKAASRLTQEINSILQQSDVRQKLADQGWDAVGASPEALRRRISSDTKMWGDVIKQSNIQAK